MISFQSARKKNIILILFLFFLLCAVLLGGFGYYLVSPMKKGGPDQTFIVEEGATLKEVADELEQRNIISSKSLFLLWTRFMGYGRRIKAGEYLLNSGMPPLEICGILRKGLIITHSVTIPEGFTMYQIGTLLEQKGLADKAKFIELASDKDLVGSYDIHGPNLEGYLYPDTYQFGRGLPPVSIIDVMVTRFKEVYAPLGERARLAGMNMKEIVILASIIEKETGQASERPVIASVFLNRLKKGMRLASDPTVIYGLGNFNGNLTRKDLITYTPYNTYVIKGLPPGPICNPGLGALRAVLYPAETDYIYFVSKNDGSHFFSRSLSEHNRAVRFYQKKQGARPEETS